MIELTLTMLDQRIIARVPSPSGERVFGTATVTSTQFGERGLGTDSGGDVELTAQATIGTLVQLK